MRQTITEQNWNEFCCICSWAFHYCILMGNWWGEVFCSFFRGNQNVMHGNTSVWKKILFFTERLEDSYWPVFTTLPSLLWEKQQAYFVPPSVLLRIIWSLNYQDFSKIERGIRLIHPRCHSSLVLCSSSSHFLSLSSGATLQRKNLTIFHCRNCQSAGSSFLKSKITPE